MEFIEKYPPVVMGSSDAFLDNEIFDIEQNEMLQFYLAVACGLTMYPPNTYPETVNKSVNELLSSLLSYRKMVNKDDKFRSYAKTAGFDFKNMKRQSPQSLLKMENIGVVCSPDLKDVKLVMKNLRKIMRAVLNCKIPLVPRSKIMGYQDMIEICEDLESTAQGRSSKTYIGMKETTTKILKSRIEVAASVICMLGSESSCLVCDLFEIRPLSDNQILNSRIVSDIWLPNIYKVSPEFWGLMCKSWSKHKFPSIPDEDLTQICETNIIPLFITQYSKDQLFYDKATNLAEQLNELRIKMEHTEDKSSEEQLSPESDSKNQIRQLKARIQDMDIQLRKANSLAVHTQRQFEKLQESYRICNSECIAAQSMVEILKAQLQELEQEESVDEPSSNSGLKDRLGEQVVKPLSSKKILIVGGHSNTQNIIREVFPEWEYEEGFRATDTSARKSLDAICVITSYCSHKCFYNAKSLAKNSSALLVLTTKTSPFSICMKIYQELFRD